MEPAKPGRGISLAEIRRAVEKITIAQAQIGVAVMGLLADPNELTAEARSEMSTKVEQSIKDLIDVARKLMEVPHGD